MTEQEWLASEDPAAMLRYLTDPVMTPDPYGSLSGGSHADNIRDCVSKGRHRLPSLKAEKHPNAKFTDDEVREIRRRVTREGRGSIKAIAEERGVLLNTISRIVRRASYATVTDTPEGGSS